MHEGVVGCEGQGGAGVDN